MKVLGNGVDIVSNSRIKKAITNYNFIKRIYSSSEIKGSKKILNKTNFLFKIDFLILLFSTISTPLPIIVIISIYF